MSDDKLRSLMTALDIAAFERKEDGSFTSVAPLPAWFSRIVSDPTFPFLGHILEEANQFWQSSDTAAREWGPVAEVDASGAEFHYKVTAVIGAGARFLLFQPDRASDEMRRVLQSVRAGRLAAEQGAGTESVERLRERQAVRRAANALEDALERFRQPGAGDDPREIATELSARSEALLKAMDTMVEPLRPSRP